jgi:hypothetical protein
MRYLLPAAIFLSLGLLVGACGGDSTPTEGGATTPPAGATTAPAAATDSQSEPTCENVSQGTVKWLESGLTVSGGGELEDAQAVRSGDFKQVYFISARIKGPSMGADTIGTWAKSGNVNKPGGLTLSIDSFAKEFSDWFPGDKEGAQYHVTMEDDGAQESRDCLGSG